MSIPDEMESLCVAQFRKGALIFAPLLYLLAACGSDAPSESRFGSAVNDCGISQELAAQGSGEDLVDGQAFEGMMLAEAERLAESQGITPRVIGRDGKCSDRTGDLRGDRVNFYVEDGKVTAAGGF